MTSLKPLRPHQQRAIDGLKQSLVDGHRRPMLQLPTGGGKTVIAAHVVAGARTKGNRVCFVVPFLSLIDQTFERFVENGIDPADMGVMQGSHPWRRPHAPVQIATAQTLARRDLPTTDVVVIDEAHRTSKVIDAWMDDRDSGVKTFIGLTATPWAKGLGRRYDDLLKPTSTQELIDLGFLSPFRVYAPSHPDLTGIKTVAGDYHEGQLGTRMSEPTLVADIVSTWLARGQGLPTLCFAVNRAHAKVLHERFADAGVSTAYIDADTPREEREAIGRRLACGDVQVVVNIGTLTTGIDWDVRCLILARPTKSEMLFVQIIGRALRTAPGKDYALILDHSDTHLRLGMVTDIDHDELDTGFKPDADRKKRERRLALPKECTECACLVPAGMTECPACGHERQLPMFAEAEGDLSEILSNGRGKSEPVTQQIARLGKQSVFSQLLYFADERSRSRGWAAHAYRDIFGVWPRNLNETWGEETSPLVRSWIRSKDIRYAKAQARIVREAGHVI